VCFPLLFKAFTVIGVNIELLFPKQGDSQTVPPENVDFYKEKDKVYHFSFIPNLQLDVLAETVTRMLLHKKGRSERGY
jgi:hypothetical protein